MPKRSAPATSDAPAAAAPASKRAKTVSATKAVKAPAAPATKVAVKAKAPAKKVAAAKAPAKKVAVKAKAPAKKGGEALTAEEEDELVEMLVEEAVSALAASDGAAQKAQVQIVSSKVRRRCRARESRAWGVPPRQLAAP